MRYLTNHSTGKMGYALAKTAARRGAKVTLVSGPCELPAPLHVDVVPVESAADMFEAVKNTCQRAGYYHQGSSCCRLYADYGKYRKDEKERGRSVDCAEADNGYFIMAR